MRACVLFHAKIYNPTNHPIIILYIENVEKPKLK